MLDIKKKTEEILRGCIETTEDGINLYTPDCKNKYGTFWTRDFSYMVENAGDLIPDEDKENAIDFFIDHAREDGWIPDRVKADGTALYTAGDEHFPALSNLDTGCFLALLIDSYISDRDIGTAKAKYEKRRGPLIKSIELLDTDENGIIVNLTTPPHSPYGFTDTIAKTGKLCYETLLYWRALKVLVKWEKLTGHETESYESRIKGIEDTFEDIFLNGEGMLDAATLDCRQLDVWASAYAVSIGFPLTEKTRKSIASWLIDNYEDIVESGQIRQLRKGESWEKTFILVKPGTYQNGACWATATGWFVDAMIDSDRKLASRTVKEAMDYFENVGIFECINGEYRKLDTFVASIVTLYGLSKRYPDLFERR